MLGSYPTKRFASLGGWKGHGSQQLRKKSFSPFQPAAFRREEWLAAHGKPRRSGVLMLPLAFLTQRRSGVHGR